MGLLDFVHMLGDAVQDPEEESFLLFSQALPSKNLGFADSKANTIDLEIAGIDLVIHQSPALLVSNRDGGTTGAVLWQVSPIFAEWLVSAGNPLFAQEALGPHSVVLELGCGIAGVVALTLATRVGMYIATDQSYVLKALKQNIEKNSVSQPKNKIGKILKDSKANSRIKASPQSKVKIIALDWEKDSLSSLPTLIGGHGTVDAVIACDCIYNEALVDPFVQTCADICALRTKSGIGRPAVCIVAQQIRSPDIFEAWAKRFQQSFKFWRLPDNLLSDKLGSNSGFSVHLGILHGHY